MRELFRKLSESISSILSGGLNEIDTSIYLSVCYCSCQMAIRYRALYREEVYMYNTDSGIIYLMCATV